MNTNYLALFLDKDSYIEKCLSLIRFISNPESTSLPHITLRLFKETNVRVDDIKNRQITYLNIIEPGSFNISENQAPFVVYIRCESEELEGIEYKPDYPFSRLHITLYEGYDIDYANSLLGLLNQQKWHFKLPFKTPRSLTERKLGVKIASKDYYEDIFADLLGDWYYNYFKESNGNEFKLRLVKMVLNNLSDYLWKQNIITNRVDSFYLNAIKDAQKGISEYIDQSESISWYKENQLSFDSFYFDEALSLNSAKSNRDPFHVTPPEYARDMAKCAINAFGDDKRRIDFGDSSIGTGALFLALKQCVYEINQTHNKKYEFNSAIGIDIDPKMSEEAYKRCSKRGLTVINGDSLSPEINLISPRNMMIVNPPFNRHKDIPKDYKQQLQNIVKEQSGIKVLGDSGLYVYHMLIMDKWLAEDGIAVWLLPTIFLQTRYGRAIREYLLNKVQLLGMHIYDENNEQFDKTDVTTTIVTFKKHVVEEDVKIAISHGDSIDTPVVKTIISRRQLMEASSNWKQVIDCYCFNENKVLAPSFNGIKFEDIFEIKRGLATGANSFFVMNRSDAEKRGIPSIALKPLLPKARYLDSNIINRDEDGYPDTKSQLVLIDFDEDEEKIRLEYPDFYEYLQIAKIKDNDGKSIVERTLVKARKPWYKQEKREPPPFLLTYMGRNKKDSPPLYFIWNKSEAIALNTYLLLYPKEWLANMLTKNKFIYEEILTALNKSAETVITQRTRVYSGGLQKLEPGELKSLPVVDLPDAIIKAFFSSR